MTSISAVFSISDYTNGIVSASIGLTSASTGTIVTSGIQSLAGVSKYSVPVSVSANGVVQISAMNYVGQSTIFTEQNFIIACDTNRTINLTNYLPQYLRDNYDGSSSEFFQFTQFFESYLNTIYTDVDKPCNLSVLEKTKRLQDLHDIDKIETGYIPYYAKMLGYNVGINKGELGTFSTNSSKTYADSLTDYQNKCLRFVVGNLPNWYSIKTTRNAVRIMLLSFGIIGDIVDYYTNDYADNWMQNKTSSGQYVADDIPSDWYPTPHISVSIDLRNSENSVVYSEQTSHILNAMEDIRPVNVVVEGLQGYISEIPAPSIVVALNFKSCATINIPRASQINIH